MGLRILLLLVRHLLHPGSLGKKLLLVLVGRPHRAANFHVTLLLQPGFAKFLCTPVWGCVFQAMSFHAIQLLPLYLCLLNEAINFTLQLIWIG